MEYKIVNGNFSYGANKILNLINFEIKDGEKVAICGRNGCGKSTLLKIITGEILKNSNANLEADEIVKSGIKNIGYLEQIVFSDENITLEDELMKVYSDIISMKEKLDMLQKKLEDEPNEKNIKTYIELEQKFKDNDGYFYQKEYNSILKAFKFSNDDRYKKIGEFSGGQKTKIAFMKLLLSKPDILLFDEPTNHLDIDSIEWLENYLADYKKSVVIVSHDRDFLDKVINVVYEIEYGKIKKYVGNYTQFVAQKKINYENDLKRYQAQQNKIKKENELIDRFRYKATKASMVQSRIKALDKIELIENPQIENIKTFHFNFKEDASGKEVLQIDSLQIGYDKILSEITLNVFRGDKIGIIGKNGVGKSTFLKTLAGKINSLGGKFNFGYNTQVGYFEQATKHINSVKTVYEDYIDEFPELNETEARNDLGCFLFTQEDVFKELSKLSGGEMARYELLKIFKRNPNILLLDEPTNHLDLVSKEQLEDILEKYQGTILAVSHDRYFIKKITKSILVFDDDVKYYPNTLEYMENRQSVLNETKTKKEKVEEDKSGYNDFLRNKEKQKKERMTKNLENKIQMLESDIKILKDRLNTPEIFENVDKLLEVNGEIENKEKELDLLLSQWYDLSN